MRILIADDNALIREGIAGILADNAWEVCGQASNGSEALAQTRALRPDLVLLDISMPGGNGFEIASAIKREMPATKVVIVSHHDFANLLVGAQGKVVDGFIDKGRLSTQLEQTITNIFAAG
jgi:DNA-binding NarL/FixJ family response regulator